MANFAYTAIEAATGRERSGTLESASAEAATADLKSRGLAPIALGPVGASPPKTSGTTGRSSAGVKSRSGLKPALPESAWRRKRPITIGPIIGTKGLALFTRQLATLVKAGMPLLRSIEVLARQQRSAAFRRVLEEIAETIRSGGNFSEALQAHPRIFDRLYINMVRAGEAGGVLDTVLDRLARFMEKAERIKGKVKSAMTYPIIVILLAAGIVAALMVFVVPKFEQIFAGLLKGQPLPALTRAVLGASYFIKHNIVVSLGVIVAVHAGFLVFRRTRAGIRAIDRLAIRLPVAGDLFLKAAIARFTRTFGTLLASGVPILQALVITRDTSGNVWVADAIDVVHDRVKEGDNVAGPLEATTIFPGMVTSMIDVGEETGALPEMLARIAETYDEEVDNAVAALTSLIEPLMIVFLALVVGTIVIALFLPIVSIIQHLQ
ncbi:MAG TPA: type II secretion system F family protein [Opitutus sp.]|nr:type II secretion system F family protein [Opitutus sp.]